MIQTKIVATLGPATDSDEMIRALLDAGVNVFRLNFSHGKIEQHAASLARIRRVCETTGSLAAVLGDLCGPKIRLDNVENDAVLLVDGQLVDIVGGHVVGNAQRISTNRPELIGEVGVGHRILIDDGEIRLRLEGVDAHRLICRVEVGGTIRTRKGVNLPDSKLKMSAMTDKDRADLAWAIENKLDYVALSFVRSAADLRELLDLLPLAGCEIRTVAKIETPAAIGHIDEIIETADVIMVARGDLGVEMDVAQVPMLQKRIVRKCQTAGKPVIVATQMLQSMVESPTPTRAEVSDVANAILDGGDAVMLSAETSVGAHAIEAVRMMVRIARETEADMRSRNELARVDATRTLRRITTAVAHGASLLTRELDAHLVAVWTDTGNTARLLSKTRLNVPVLGLSPDAHVCRRMSMYYGIIPTLATRHERILQMLKEVDDLLIRRQLAKPGDLIVVIAGTRLEQEGATNALLMHLVGGADSAPAFA
ncbi:MAG TPA: pyruvate kinase [Phycisphaerae bacterium]|nr:pyruvate kinase [Phycisphaerae bacterium]